jgi:hypothetical protein
VGLQLKLWPLSVIAAAIAHDCSDELIILCIVFIVTEPKNDICKPDRLYKEEYLSGQIPYLYMICDTVDLTLFFNFKSN